MGITKSVLVIPPIPMIKAWLRHGHDRYDAKQRPNQKDDIMMSCTMEKSQLFVLEKITDDKEIIVSIQNPKTSKAKSYQSSF